MKSKTKDFDRFKYAEEWAHGIDGPFVLFPWTGEFEEDGETYTTDMYTVVWVE